MLGEAFAALGFAVRRVPGRGAGDHLLAHPRDRLRAHPFQLLVGHLDTVWPLGTLEQMPVRAVDGRLYGPGVFDMKGGLVQMLFALRALSELDLTPTVTPVAFVVSDEELGSSDSERHLLRLARSSARAFVLEPGLWSDREAEDRAEVRRCLHAGGRRKGVPRRSRAPARA